MAKTETDKELLKALQNIIHSFIEYWSDRVLFARNNFNSQYIEDIDKLVTEVC